MMEFSFILYFILFIWPHHTACRILVPWPEIKSVSPALEDTVLSAVYQGSAFNCLKSLYSYFKFWIFRMSFSLVKLPHEIPPSFIYICVCVCVFVYMYIYIICIYNWRISALQGCVGFCHTIWLSHR